MLYLVSLLIDFSTNQLTFSMTRGMAELRASPIRIGVIGACFAAASTLCNPIAGHLSDRFGRRAVAVAGVVLMFLSFAAVLGFSVGHWGAMVAYTAAGAAVGVIYPPIIAWLSQGLSGRRASRVFLYFCIAFNFGVICGQHAAGWLYQNYTASGPLMVGMGLHGVIAALLLFAKPSPPPEQHGNEDEASTAKSERLLSSAFSMIAWVANVSGMFCYSIVLYHLPRLLVRLDIPPETHGEMLAGSRMIVIATFVAMHFTTFWRHRLWIAMTVQLFACGGLVLLATADSAGLLTLGLAALALLTGSNYFASLYYTSTGSADRVKGRATGIHEATLAFGLCAGSLVGGFVGDTFTDRAPFWLAATVVAAWIIPQWVVYAKLVPAARNMADGQNAVPAKS